MNIEAIIGAQMQALAASEGHKPALPDMSWAEVRTIKNESVGPIRECAIQGLTKKQTADQLGFSLSRVCHTAHRHRIEFQRKAA